MDKTCQTHHVRITTVDEDLKHMGPDCIVYESGGDFGGIEEILPGAPQSAIPFDGGYDMGTVSPIPTKEEKDFFIKRQGIPKTDSPKKLETLIVDDATK